MARILVVEDSRTQAQELRLVLESAGFTVEAVANAEAALLRLAVEPFDLVLSDVLLPGRSGYDLCRALKSDPQTSSLPVVLLTALNDPLDVLEGLQCGADNFLTKPYDASVLLRRLRAILTNQARRTDSAESGVALSFRGQGVTITSDKEQIVDLLFATLEGFIRSKEREHQARLTREALEGSRRLIQSSLDALTEQVAALDNAGTVLAVNAAWRRSVDGNPLLGPGCGLGTNYLARCAEAAGSGLGEAAQLAEAIREVLAGQRHELTLEYRCPGPEGDCWFTVRAARFEGAEPAGAVVAHEDVTERRRLEESLRRRMDELAEAGRRKDAFLMMLAHELRNPLAPILNGLHVARQPGMAAAAREQALTLAERQARHLGALVDDLLDVSRLLHGQVKLHRERLDLAHLVRSAADERRGSFETAGLTLQVETPETPVWIRGDALRLEQALGQLLENAIRFTPTGGRVAVRLNREADAQAALVVQDSGAGIAQETLPRLFEVFSQAEQGLERAQCGLGLGLALVKGLVELHGGSVQAASAGLGRGATFTLRLPVEGEPAALTEAAESAPVGGPRRRILIVEDNRDAAESLRLLLETEGHEVRVAHSGPAGVQAAAWGPEVVLSDIGLPGLDGYGVAAALRRHPATAQALLIAVTGYGRDEDVRRAREAGFDRHLVKPACPEELMRLVAAGHDA